VNMLQMLNFARLLVLNFLGEEGPYALRSIAN
jgi:hypothetical protein